MSAVAYPLAKHGAEAFTRMLRVPYNDTLFLVIPLSDFLGFYFSA
jgi:hypothetical protein